MYEQTSSPSEFLIGVRFIRSAISVELADISEAGHTRSIITVVYIGKCFLIHVEGVVLAFVLILRVVIFLILLLILFIVVVLHILHDLVHEALIALHLLQSELDILKKQQVWILRVQL